MTYVYSYEHSTSYVLSHVYQHVENKFRVYTHTRANEKGMLFFLNLFLSYQNQLVYNELITEAVVTCASTNATQTVKVIYCHSFTKLVRTTS